MKSTLNRANGAVLIAAMMVSGPVQIAFADLDDLEEPEQPLSTKKDGPAQPENKSSNSPTQKSSTDLGPSSDLNHPTGKSKVADEVAAPPPFPSKTQKPRTKASSNKRDANSTNKKGPIRWKSKGLLATQEKSIVELEKDVEIVQDNLSLTADYSKIYFTEAEAGDVEKVYVRGNVHIEKKDDDPANHVVAKSNEATYYSLENKITLIGNARLWRQGNLVKGKKITYDLKTGWITVDSVEGVVQSSDSAGGTK